MRLLLLLATAVASSTAKTIENKLIGAPQVDCGPDAIRIRGQTEEVFEGQIFVRTKRHVPECFIVYDPESNSTAPEFAIALDRISACGIEMKRNSELKSLELRTIIAISFHPHLVTSGDRAYSVQCVFTQSQVTVGTNVDFISDFSPSIVLSSSSLPPSVSLSLLSSNASTPLSPSTAVSIGEPLMLVWSLSAASPIWGLRVQWCVVENDVNQAIQLIDNSCSIHDRSLISDVMYSDDSSRASSDVQAFKFSSSDEIVFKCSVRTCIKRFDHLVGSTEGAELCPDTPDCVSLVGGGRGKRDAVPGQLVSTRLLLHFQ